MSVRPRLKPYKVLRKIGGQSGWAPHVEVDEHEEALARAESCVDQFGGMAVVVSQHVIAQFGPRAPKKPGKPAAFR